MYYDLTAENLLKLLDYDRETGVFTWRTRSRDLFIKETDCRGWNKKYAGKEAGRFLSGRSKYRVIRLFYKEWYSHRLAWLYVYGKWPKDQIDHINGDKGDNRIANLRDATPQQNSANTSTRKNGTSGFKGVTFNKNAQKWVAQLFWGGKGYWLGFHDSPKLASLAYNACAEKLHGEFARAA
jgi:hypothetical protein